MFAVIFEVKPKMERKDDYLALAKILKPELEKIDGFIDNERFRSMRTEGRILSLSTWRDEKAVVRWRTLGVHHEIQKKGRNEIFEDYHLRVGEITTDTHIPESQKLQEQRFDETVVGPAKAASITELADQDKKPASADLLADLNAPIIGTSGVLNQDVFESITNPGKLLLLVSWKDAAAARVWQPTIPGGRHLRHRRVRIIRDYGMLDRREAPQFYPPVERGVCPYVSGSSMQKSL
jgi:heme-degrading monooxygenase HmoA